MHVDKHVEGDAEDIAAIALAQLRDWLDETLPDGWQNVGSTFSVSEWQNAFLESGFAAPSWPRHLGGLGLETAGARLITAELIDRGAPVPRALLRALLVGAALLVHATPEQQRRFLPRMADGRDRWCQLFSEPGAGSDLASLSTRAVGDGSSWVISGQKVWSSYADDAEWGLLLARTDSGATKRRGITAFAIDMSAPGVEVRGLRQMTGDSEFCEVFLNGVVISDDLRIGALNDGWAVARATLEAERELLGGPGSSPVARIGGLAMDDLLNLARDVADGQRRLLVECWVRDRIVRVLGERLANRGEAGSLVKLAQAEHNQTLQSLAVDLLGPFGAASEPDDEAAAKIWWGFLRSRANTVAGGTSEILRSVIGERLLGLPREPDPYERDSWSDVPRS